MPDAEKLPTTPVQMVIVDGVRITSRYKKQDETALMARVVAAMPAAMRRAMAEMNCDSKQGLLIGVEMRPEHDTPSITAPIASRLSELLLEFNGSHNAIQVGDSHLDPDWSGRDDDERDGQGRAI